MPPSQLKRLKSSLREQGIVGPQKSKKQKKAAAKDKTATDRIQRNAALQQIRESFNPFEYRQAARPAKFESVSQKSANAKKYKDVLHRPGVSKSAGEEMRRRQLLPELQRRNKVGGLIDRRIGESDPGMTPEERAVQRFAREKKGKASLFDLEGSDDDEPRIGLTHLGKSLDEFEGDDFDAGSLKGSDDENDELLRRKRPLDDDEDGPADQEGNGEPDRKKTKKEVMDEVIAKSKYHKYERQKTKEDDDDIRAELDQGMGEMLALLRGHPVPPKAEPKIETNINPDRQKLLDGMDRTKVDKDYEVRLRQLAQDTRAKPSDRTKTAEEKAKDEAERVKELEEKRSKRMRGEPVSDDEDDEPTPAQNEDDLMVIPDENEVHDEAAEFGFTTADARANGKEQGVVHDDEDEFDFDEDLVASGSDVDVSEESESDNDSDAEGSAGDDGKEEEEEDEFVRGILDPSGGSSGANTIELGTRSISKSFPCPRSHEELLDVTKDVPMKELPSVVQRIRAQHHPSLSASNMAAMADFAASLVDHISYLATTPKSLPTIEHFIRHLHSLSRTYPEQVADAFRGHLKTCHQRGHPLAGDFVILTAIGSIYPTSDHFHQVVTPAITLMARWLSLNQPNSSENLRIGAYLVALSLDYQKLSKRYIPEAVRFTLQALKQKNVPDQSTMKLHIDNLSTMADLWKDKSAFVESFTSALPIMKKLGTKQKAQHLEILLQQSRQQRRPLELHHHRPQPIRTSIPKFEEGFNPDKHYDPDKERSEAKKLQKEYKRERKGAMRELRKDANFIAREQLREKKIRDAEYEKKQRRLIAEIQSEEGHEAKEYEREKTLRKGKK